MTEAARTVRGGARLIGTNEDPTHPTPSGLLLGAGALLAAVATASETVPEVAGKPHRPTANAILGPWPMTSGSWWGTGRSYRWGPGSPSWGCRLRWCFQG